MGCLNFEDNMSLALGLYSEDAAYRMSCMDMLTLRYHSISWEVWHIMLMAPIMPEDEDLQVKLLELLATCPDLPKITAPILYYFNRIVQHTSPKVQEAYRSLREEFGGEVFVNIFMGYED